MNKSEILKHVHRWTNDPEQELDSKKEKFSEFFENVVKYRAMNNNFQFRYRTYPSSKIGKEECTRQDKELFYAESIWGIQQYIKQLKK